MNRLRPLLLPTIAGVLYFLSWIGFGIWPLAFVCFLPLLWALRGTTLKQAFLRGWWFGFVLHLGGYTWIMHLLQVFAEAPAWVAFLGYLLLCTAQGLLFAAMSLLLVWLQKRTRWHYVALLPISLAASELCIPLLFQSYTGVALMPVLPLVQIADLGGPILLSALQALINGALFDAFVAYRDREPAPLWPMSISLIALLGTGAYGFLRLVQMDAKQLAAPHVRIGLAQPNVGATELHENPLASVRTLRDETAEISAREGSLAIWPEVGFNTQAVPEGATDGRAIQGNIPIALIAGVERVSHKDVWNSAIAIDTQGRIGGHYDKMQLLAFGESIPGGEWFPKVYDWLPQVGHLSRGKTTAPLKLLGYRFGTFICYEGILPAIVNEIMTDHGEGRPHALVNLTNDSWYGAGHEQEEHLMLAVVRSIEHRRWLLRATSTGISAFVDATGRIVQRIGRNERGVAVQNVPMLQGQTVFEVLGMWPGWAALACFAWAFVFKRPAKA
ncbi:MAG TPA: apolipoprotein N-acyltransferase [Myxococcales bacterium]|jgi:apolipoprotein N-acyltransferase|nr:apolipoprotein N-acyltransferase [Myxococcales bacterium]